MVVNKFGRYWELPDTLTSASGESNLNEMLPMGYPFRLDSDGVLDIRVNAINWQKVNGALIEVLEQGPITLADNSTSYLYYDSNGTLTVSVSSFPDPSSNEFFACAKIVTNAGVITEIHPYIRPSPSSGGGGGSGGNYLHQSFPISGGETVFNIIDPVSSPLSILLFIGSLRANLTDDYTVSGPNNQTITLTAPAYPVRANDKVVAYYQPA